MREDELTKYVYNLQNQISNMKIALGFLFSWCEGDLKKTIISAKGGKVYAKYIDAAFTVQSVILPDAKDAKEVKMRCSHANYAIFMVGDKNYMLDKTKNIIEGE